MKIEFLKKALYEFTSQHQVKEIVENQKKGKVTFTCEIESENKIIMVIDCENRNGYSGFRKTYENK